jgi:hypothetical protein
LMKQTGEYDLEVVTHEDWDGLPVSKDILSAGTDDSNIFTAGAKIEKWSVSDKRHVPTSEEMREAWNKNIKDEESAKKIIEDRIEKQGAIVTAEFNDLENKNPGALRKMMRFSAMAGAVETLFDRSRLLHQNRFVSLRFKDPNGNISTYTGKLVEVVLPNEKANLSPSNIGLKFMVNSPSGFVNLKLSNFMNGDRVNIQDVTPWSFTSAQEYEIVKPETTREERYFITGNPVAGFTSTGGLGKYVRFRANDGSLVTGIMMSRGWGPSQLVKDPRYELVNGKAAARFLFNFPRPMGISVGDWVVRKNSAGRYYVDVPAAKRTGGEVFLDDKLLESLEFEKDGRRMKAEVYPSDYRNMKGLENQVAGVIDRIMEISGSRFKPHSNLDADMKKRVEESNTAAQPGGTMFRRGVSPREDAEKRYVRAMPSTDPRARMLQGDVEVSYAYGLTPTTVAEAMNDASITYNKDAGSKLAAQVNLMAGGKDSGIPKTDAERMAIDKLAVDDMTVAAVSDPSNDNKMASAMLAIWRWFERGTDVARALQLRIDPVNTPEGRRAWILRNILAPTKTEAEIIRKAETTAQAIELLKGRAKYAKAVLDRLNKKGMDVSKITAAQLMDDVFVADLLQEIAVARSGWGDMIHEWWRNAILSAPTTQIVNAMGNFGHAVMEAAVQRPVEAVINTLVGNKDAATFASINAMYKAIAPSIAEANKAFMKSWATERTVTGPGASKIEDANVAIPSVRVNVLGTKMDIGGKQVRWSQRIMSATDEWFKTVFMAMLTADYATREFDNLVKDGKKKESERDAFVAKQVDPGSEAYAKAWDETLRWAFQQKPGRMAASVMHWRNDPKFGFLIKFMLPFVKTPANIISTGIRKTPLGALPYMYNLWKGNYKGGDALRLGAEQAVGMVLMASLYALMKGDDDDELNRPRITGSKRTAAWSSKGAKESEMQNTPPMSIRVGDKWVSYARLEPVATMVATMVDLLTMFEQAKDGKYAEIPMTFFSSVRGNMADKTFLQGVGNILSIVEGDTFAIQRAMTNTLAGFNPNIIRSTARAFDPYIRDVKNRDKGTEWLKTAAERFGQTVLPAASIAPPPKMDKTGKPIEHEGGALYNTIVPFRQQSATKTTKVDAMLSRWNEKVDKEDRFYPATPNPRKVKIGRDELSMNDQEYVEFQRIAGEHAAMVLGRQSFNFDNPTERDIERVKKIYENARNLAAERVRPMVVRRWRSEQGK